jgi:hypothetical protein
MEDGKVMEKVVRIQRKEFMQASSVISFADAWQTAIKPLEEFIKALGKFNPDAARELAVKSSALLIAGAAGSTAEASTDAAEVSTVLGNGIAKAMVK